MIFLRKIASCCTLLVSFCVLLLLSFPVLASVVIDGSATVYPITEALVEAYQDSSDRAANQRIVISISGTGGGFQRFCRGELDIVDASRPILKSEMLLCSKNGVSYVELPVAYDAVAIIVNPKNSFVRSVSVLELRKIWGVSSDSKVIFWNQVNKAYPRFSLTLYGPGPGSGTFDYFTSLINGKTGLVRSDFHASQSDDVLVHAVSHDPYGMAYFGYAYYASNNGILRIVPVDKGDGPVLPSIKTISNGDYLLARPLFVYVSLKSTYKLDVASLMRYYLSNASRFAKDSGYFPLPRDVYEAVLARLDARILGTIYGGELASSTNLKRFLSTTLHKK